MQRRNVYLEAFRFHQKARNLSPATIRVAGESLGQFLAEHDPTTATKQDVQRYLSGLAARCRPATVWTSWRHLVAFYKWLHEEGDIAVNPMHGIPRPIVPPTEVGVLTAAETASLVAACDGAGRDDRRDMAIITMMLDTGMRLAEVTALATEDVGEDYSIRVFGKGRKFRTVRLGPTATRALARWMRVRGQQPGPLWSGRRGALGRTGVARIVKRRGQLAGLVVHPHMLRHTFVDRWLRAGGSAVDLARLCGWTSSRMADRYARLHADERALDAHVRVRPLESALADVVSWT